MKKFKYNYTKLIIALFIIGIVIALACIALNVYRLIANFRGGYEISGYDWFIVILAIVLSLFFIAIAISCFISSYYEIVNKTIVLHWGFIKNVIEIKEITKINYYEDKNRLELVFADDSYFYVSTSLSWVDDFVTEIKTVKPEIVYIQQSTSEETK